jgi:uncharacterized protein (DUF58 family)
MDDKISKIDRIGVTDNGEFHYRIALASGGVRPGAHPGKGLGAGQEFAAHARLFDLPDPRRIDLRASLRNARREPLVRTFKQRAAVPVHAIVDVSASMMFGAQRAKLDVVADFAAALGHSAYRAGDPVGLLAFDADVRDDLHVPARHSRGVGSAMADLLRGCVGGDLAPSERDADCGAALAATVERLAGNSGLVFLVSDFHWVQQAGEPLLSDFHWAQQAGDPLLQPGLKPGMAKDAAARGQRGLLAALDMLAHAQVVPIVVWDPAEMTPPQEDVLLSIVDAESGMRRTLWVGAQVRAQWLQRVSARRAALDALFASAGVQAFHMHGVFEPEALTRHFLEGLE